ncbi:unnamed protein product [Fraxinus pennsylvanica]|uniref:DUF7913 domain-containing protein n=1 Tax=Fraxinus pennsylvanica TaxID=56036 RepID=A0AAD1Z1U5_9LAMI|nr:unnamed protein product [Fraxinus pennsylvanica]
MTAFMKFMNQGEFMELNDTQYRLSTTEKAVKDVCDISVALDPSKDVPNIEGWPISNIAVLLTGSKGNCLLHLVASVPRMSYVEVDTRHRGTRQLFLDRSLFRSNNYLCTHRAFAWALESVPVRCRFLPCSLSSLCNPFAAVSL